MENREWVNIKLGEALTFQRGHDLPKSQMIEGNYQVAGSNGTIGFHNVYTTKGPGITIGRSGNIGTPHYYKDNFWAHNTVLYVKDFKGNSELFLYYFLKNIDFSSFNTGSAVPSLNRNHIHEYEIQLPPLPEQKAIASVLSSLDDKIDLLHQQNQTLEALAETLFRQWFIEEAKEDWEEGILDDILSVKGGTTPSTNNPSFWNGNIHWTTPRDITTLNGIYLFDTERKITELGLSKISSGLLPKGTLLMTSRAPVGVLAFTEVPIAINQGYIAILDNKQYSKEFIYLWLKCNIDYVHSFSNGSTFMEISKSAFKSLKIQKPPVHLTEKFQKIIEPIFIKLKLNSKQIQTLTQLRDTLLPKLMSGEVRVQL